MQRLLAFRHGEADNFAVLIANHDVVVGNFAVGGVAGFLKLMRARRPPDSYDDHRYFEGGTHDTQARS